MNLKNIMSQIYQKIENFRYKKFISSFSNPQENEKRIAKDLKGLQEFDLVGLNRMNELAGVKKKRFVLLDSEYFSDYLNSVKEGKSFYTSYLKDEDIIQEFLPNNFSVLLKKLKRSFADRESIASKILNYFQIETTANVAIDNPSDYDFKFLASLDFLKKDEEFYSFYDIDCNYHFCKNSNLEDVDKFVDYMLKRFSRLHIVFNLQKKKEEIKEKVIYSYFVRYFLLGDCDLHAGNFGIVYNKKTKNISFAPNFDFDGSLMHHSYCKKSLVYMNDKYPKLFEKFVKNYNKFKMLDSKTNKHVYEMFFEDVRDEVYYDLFINRMGSNIWAIDKALEEMQNEKSYR